MIFFFVYVWKNIHNISAKTESYYSWSHLAWRCFEGFSRANFHLGSTQSNRGKYITWPITGPFNQKGESDFLSLNYFDGSKISEWNIKRKSWKRASSFSPAGRRLQRVKKKILNKTPDRIFIAENTQTLHHSIYNTNGTTINIFISYFFI